MRGGPWRKRGETKQQASGLSGALPPDLASLHRHAMPNLAGGRRRRGHYTGRVTLRPCASLLFTEVKSSEEQYNKIVIPNEESVVIYYKIRQQLAKLGKEIEEYIHKPKYCLPFLQPGRLVKVCCSLHKISGCSNTR